MSYELLEGLSWAVLGFLVGIPTGVGILFLMDKFAYDDEGKE